MLAVKRELTRVVSGGPFGLELPVSNHSSTSTWQHMTDTGAGPMYQCYVTGAEVGGGGQAILTFLKELALWLIRDFIETKM